MKKCPVPGCNHLCEFLTKNHCETVHNMTRDEVYKKYGKERNMYNDRTIVSGKMIRDFNERRRRRFLTHELKI